MHPMLNIAIRAARRAGKIMIKAYENPISIEIKSQNHNSMITNIDIAVETLIIDIIKKAYPEHTIISEMAGVLKGKDANTQWIIDPIDGTDNFARGLPYFSTSIALRIDGKTEVAVVFNPITNELFTTERGKGAQLNDRRLRINSAARQLPHSFVATHQDSTPEEYLTQSGAVLDKLINMPVTLRDLGCASLDLCYVAAGRIDLFYALHLKAWQLAAGELILREAGGLLTDFSGNPNYFSSGNTVASAPKIMKEFLVTTQPFWAEGLLK